MDDLTLIVTISAAICAILAGKAILSSGCSELKGRARKINESLYELHMPSVPPSIQIVLFHGLQPGNYSDAHLRTWQSEDGSCIWPQTWLVDADAVPGARVLSVSYNGGMENTSIGESDLHIITENILSDLMQENIGQEDSCPVILVGHSIGGVVIKHLCHRAHVTLQNKPSGEIVKREKFLNNIKGIFYYATPNHGTSIPKKWEKDLPRAFLAYFKTLSKDAARLNQDFHSLERVCNEWSLASLGENRATNSGLSKFFFRSVFVPEASARVGDFNVVDRADHFSICRPSDKLSRSFYKLKDFVGRIAKVAQDAKKLEGIRLQEEARALENPDNFQYLPKSVTGLDVQVKAIESKLVDVRTLGLVGMGGLGKTTLAKEVFNRLAPSFEYTCFILNVKVISGDEKKVKNKIEEEMHCRGKKVLEQKSNDGSKAEWKRKPLLLVLDDISEQRDGKFISELVDIVADESRIIFTTRNQSPLEYMGEVYRVDFLDNTSANELFLSCAFPNDKTPPTELEGLISNIIEKCEGLPLTLEILGKFLRTKEKSEEWKQTLDALSSAQDVKDIDERLWKKLRLSYDGLEEKLKQMFLDATTFFSVEHWTLYEAKAVWRVAHTTSESLSWRKLVEMSLVYDVKDNDSIRVHEQLQSLGRKIARESINNGKRREWNGEEGLKLLQNTEELHKQDVFALRIGKSKWGEESSIAYRMNIANTAFPSLTELRYLEVNVPVQVDVAQDCLPFQAKLVLLQCQAPEVSHILLHPVLGADLVLLYMSWEKSSLSTCIGSFSKLRFLKLCSPTHLKSLPDEIGKLSLLEIFTLESCNVLQTLPESFGDLSALNHLRIFGCKQLQALPASFGNLSALSHLEFRHCDQLQTLPESFGNLSALLLVKFLDCRQLQTLPASFGNLSALRQIEFIFCGQLRTLPESFGDLSALNDLRFNVCQQLEALPESFGSLSVLNHLEFVLCIKLHTLPESFGNLSALTFLKCFECRTLLTLPESFRKLCALNYLEFTNCDNLKALPEFLEGALPTDPANIIFRFDLRPNYPTTIPVISFGQTNSEEEDSEWETNTEEEDSE